MSSTPLEERLRSYDPVTSPWIDLKSPFTRWEATKMVLLLPLLPLRILTWIVAVFVLGVGSPLITLGCDLEQPLPRWRRRLLEWHVQTWCGVFLASCGFWLPVAKGRHYVDQGRQMGGIVVFNHISYVDAFVVVWFCAASGLTMEFVKSLPVLGPGIRTLQNLYLPKDGQRSATSMVELIKERAAALSMPVLAVAPEGTLSNGRCLLTFKSGAFVPGVPVVPLLLRYQLQPFNPAWSIIRPPWHLLRMMSQFRNPLIVEALPPYVPSAEERADPVLYASNVRRLMARHLGVGLVDEDRPVMMALENAGIKVSWDGKRIVDSKGVLDGDGRVDLTPHWRKVVEGRSSSGNARAGGKVAAVATL